MDVRQQTQVLKAQNATLRRVSILGSTGSVGCNTVDLIRRCGGEFVVEALTANRNVELLLRQARELRPKLAVIAESSLFHELENGLAGTGVEAAAGRAAVIEALR